jgi:hypothetical protein
MSGYIFDGPLPQSIHDRRFRQSAVRAFRQAKQATEKVAYFVIPSEARNLS